MNITEIDLKILRENFDDEMIKKLDQENVIKIMRYLNENGVYYFKDLFLLTLDLFLIPHKEFIEKFERLKKTLGTDYVNKLEEDFSLIELMYQ